MQKNFKESMGWLHTWSGLILGWFLFAIFVTGTSSYYKNEINLWMKPEFHTSQTSEKTMQIAVNKAIEAASESDNVNVALPNSRSNLIAVRAQNTKKQIRAHKKEKTTKQISPRDQKTVHDKQKDSNKNSRKKKRKAPFTYYDASTGELIKETTKTAGGNFLYRFHFELYNIPRDIARWIVGIATMSMLVAIITGIIIHKRIFKDIFTFRPRNNTRGWMDAHILPAVAALPFLIMITYSGLLLLSNTMFPYGVKAYYDDNFMAYKQDMMKAYSKSDTQKTPILQKQRTESVQENKNTYRIVTANALRDLNRYTNNTAHRIIKANRYRQVRSSGQNNIAQKSNISKEQLLAVLGKAEKIRPGNIGGFNIIKKGDTTLVQITPKDPSTLFSSKMAKESVTFNAQTAEIIKETNPPLTDSIVLNTSTAFRALHEAKFADSTLRFIFFLSGVMGTILAGTGLILWIEKRKKRNLQKRTPGFWLVEKLNLGTMVGIFIAIGAFFIANRVIMVEESARRSLEINIFFLAWALSYIHAFIQNTSKAWKEQLLLAAIVFVLVPVINALTVFESFSQILDRDSIFIYFDLFAVFMAAVFIFIRSILIRKGAQK